LRSVKMMICVGQAGNQIGASTARRTGPLSHLDLATEALAEQEARTRRTKPSGFVFVDSEPKVVRTIVSEGSNSYLPFVSLNGSVVWDHNGRGNNWAWGYTGLASHRPGAAAGAAGSGAVKSPLGSERGQPLWQRALAAIHDQVRAAMLWLWQGQARPGARIRAQAGCFSAELLLRSHMHGRWLTARRCQLLFGPARGVTPLRKRRPCCHCTVAELLLLLSGCSCWC
jgi:hypothetical protein